MDTEVSGYRFQPQRQRHVLEDTLEASDHEKKDKREAERTKKTSRCQLVAVPNQFVDAVTSFVHMHNIQIQGTFIYSDNTKSARTYFHCGP